MRKFIDERDPNKIITEEELRQEYTETEMELTFPQYVEMCLSRNGGTLTEVKEETI